METARSVSAGTLAVLRARFPPPAHRHLDNARYAHASPSLVADLKEGTIDSLVVQNPYAMGFEGVRALCEKLEGKTPERRIDTGVTLVTRENLSDVKIQELLNPKND